MYQQNPYSYGYGAYQQTYYPIANQGWNGNQQVSQQIPQRPMTFSQQSNLYEKVNGFEEVRSYHMPSGAQMLFVDANNPYLYTKSTDVSGRAEIHAFELKEISIDDIGQPKVDLSGYVTKEDFEQSQKEISELIRSVETKILAQVRNLSLESKEITGIRGSNILTPAELPLPKDKPVERSEIKRENAIKKSSKQQEANDEQSVD